MATYTDFLNLELPAGSDYYNVGVTNANFQKLAAFLSSLSAEQVAYLNAAMDGVENVKQALDAQQVDLANKVNKLASNLTLYVAKTGSDNGDGTQGSPFLTVQKAIDYAGIYYNPKYIVTINIGDGVYTENLSVAYPVRDFIIQSLSGNRSTVTIKAPATNVRLLTAKALHLEIRNITFDESLFTSGTPFACYYNGHYEFTNCEFIGNDVTGSAGLIIANGANASISDCVFTNCKVALYALHSSFAGCHNAEGSGNETGYRSYRSIIIRSGTTMEALTLESKIMSGQIFS